MDRIWLAHPFYGSPRITHALREMGHRVNHKRVERLMRQMGISAVLPGPHTSRPHPQHVKWPYLLRGMRVERPMQVWCADITYIPLRRGHLYLCAVMDWFSRYVVGWGLSNSMDSGWCAGVLEKSLRQGTPEVFNTDQGAQFTSEVFTGLLEQARVAISMDGRGRALDNVFIERLWWSLKYEEVYLRDYQDGLEARRGLTRYFGFYNNRRPHRALQKRTPAQVHHGWLTGQDDLTAPPSACVQALSPPGWSPAGTPGPHSVRRQRAPLKGVS